jgi:hypothetical protein
MPTGEPGSSGGTRLATMMARAQQKRDQLMAQGGAAAAEAKAANEAAAEARQRESAADAEAAGIDPHDKEAMQRWRRDLAQQARERMAASAAARAQGAE